MSTRPCYERLATWRTQQDGRPSLLVVLAMRDFRGSGTLDLHGIVLRIDW